MAQYLQALIPLPIVIGLWLIAFSLGTALILTAATLTLSSNWRVSVWRAWLSAQPFMLSAAFLGWLAGVSSAPVLGAVLPAALTLVGGLVTTALTKEISVKVISTFVVVVVPVGLTIGAIAGATHRTMEMSRFEAALFSDEVKSALIRRGQWLAEVEDGIRLSRQSLGLPVSTEPAASLQWLVRPTLPGDGRSEAVAK